MEYKLSEAEFVNDFYYIETANGNTVVFNLVDEQIESQGLTLTINAINVAVVDNDGNYIEGVNVIGEGNEYYMLTTEYMEYLGKPLTKDNIVYCVLEVSDED